jgi:hypothetical protein
MDLQPRDTAEVAFELPTSEATQSRDWFLQLTGTSTAGSVLAARATPSGTDGDNPLSLRLVSALTTYPYEFLRTIPHPRLRWRDGLNVAQAPWGCPA